MSRTQDLPARFEIERDEVPFFILLFQYGVRIRCTTGVSIEGLLVTGLGIARAYLEKRLGTVFLDGSPVDDIGETFIMSDMTLALSSAMPGLAGATLPAREFFHHCECLLCTGMPTNVPGRHRMDVSQLNFSMFSRKKLARSSSSAVLGSRPQNLRDLSGQVLKRPGSNQ